MHISPEELLKNAPYIGDRAKCNLTAEQAQAYADAIDNLRGTYEEARYAALVDVADDGWPVLITMAYESIYGLTIWHIVDGTVTRYDYNTDYFGLSGLEMLNCQGSKSLAFTLDGDGYAADSGFLIHGCQNGQIRPTHTFLLTYDIISVETDEYEIYYYVDDQEVSATEYSNAVAGISDRKMLVNYWTGVGDDIGSPQNLASALRNYASLGGGYAFPTAESVDEAAVVNAIAKAVADAVGGEIQQIYKLDEGIYYVVILVNGSKQSVLVQGGRKNGQLTWAVTERFEGTLSNDDLTEKRNTLQSVSNVTLDYTVLREGDGKKAAEQLESALNNLSGTVPNDPAKNEIADYIGLAISSACTISLDGRDNRFFPDPKRISSLRDQAVQARADYDQLLDAHGVTLNRPITVIIRIVWNNMDDAAPCQITLNKALLEALDGCDAQILLGDIRHYIHISAENLQTLLTDRDSVDIQFAREDAGKYSINFLDSQGNVIDRLETPIGFALPADNELTTIMVSYTGGSTNWGGQFDPAAGCIAFDASYSGHYELLDNAAEIQDIAGLDEELRSAIAFLVSKGYMSLEGNCFLPDESLNRYQFAQAIVGMFFALGLQQQTRFEDVPADSPYYSYVASGEGLNIIKGYDERHFGDEDGLTIEQMLALAARTLIQHKGYAEPTVPYDYLSSFSDGYDVSDWAQSQVALAVREGLVDRGGQLRPGDTVTRSEAALILYRLFLLLHEVPVVALELPEQTTSPSGGIGTAGIAVIGVGAAAAIGAGAWFFLRKKGKPV